MIKLSDIPENLRLMLKRNYQTLLISKAIKKFKTIESLANEFNVNRSTIYCWKREWWPMKIIYLKKLMKILNISSNEICDQIMGVKGESNVILFFKKKLPVEIPVELIAHLQGDGSVKTRDGACNYTNQEYYLIRSFIKTFQKIFNTKINVYKTRRYTQVTLPAVVGKILTHKFDSFESKKFIIPNLKNEQNIKKYLIAIFDDEGSVVDNKKKRHRYISLRLRNMFALKEIRKMLARLGINSKIYEYKDELRISRFENIVLFAKKVGFTHPLQEKKLRKLLKNYKLKPGELIEIYTKN